MTRLPSLKPKQVVEALKKAGFIESHQTGSHLIMEKPDHPQIITIPMHNRDLKRGTIANIISQSGLNKDEFIKLL